MRAAMADLLECLIQIKGLRDTCTRLEEMLQRHPMRLWLQRPRVQKWTPAEIVAHMADAELFFGVCVRLMLTGEHAFLPAFEQGRLAARARYSEWPPLLAPARFRTRREETLELLEMCSADDLARTGEHPRRGLITVADLVAIMLAHDTEHLGQARERLALAADEEHES